MRIEISQKAKLDLARILAYLEPRSPSAASGCREFAECAKLPLVAVWSLTSSRLP
jgi:hypothetical protein